ncbi:hypothetical protein HDV00_010658 [Rhizophlyctis rosea]|nr:hypothetical protein HDV00_010658 [Rhizophlyctis rosea]
MMSQSMKFLRSTSTTTSRLLRPTSSRSYHHSTPITIPPVTHQSSTRDLASKPPVPPPHKSQHNFFPHVANAEAGETAAPSPSNRSQNPSTQQVKNTTRKSIQELDNLSPRELRSMAGARTAEPPTPAKLTDHRRINEELVKPQAQQAGGSRQPHKGSDSVERFAKPGQVARSTTERLEAAKEAMPEGGVKPVKPF